MTQADKVEIYLRDVQFRVLYFVFAIVTGLAVVIPVKLMTDMDYPGWKLFLLVHGVIFWPVFIWRSFRKQGVSTAEACRISKGKQDG